jgi:flagellin
MLKAWPWSNGSNKQMYSMDAVQEKFKEEKNMRINHNISALNTYRQLSANNAAGGKSLEKLSSGLRINRAGDDAAGLAISEKMRGRISGLNSASSNAQDGISLIQTAEGALNESTSILQRMRELAVQGANDTLQPTDRTAIATEMTQLSSELDRIGDTTQFNKTVLLDGTFGVKLATGGAAGTLAVGADGVGNINISGGKASTTYTLDQNAAGEVTLDDGNGNQQRLTGLAASFTGTLNFDKMGVSIDVTAIDLSGTAWSGDGKTIKTAATADQYLQIGANAGQTLGISIGDMRSAALGVNALSVVDNTSANAAITAIDSATATVSSQRSQLGAWQNRLEHTINNLGTASENLTSAESRIRDVDMAQEMMTYTKNSILSQAATAMLAQANQAPQEVLQLLK